ncbi:hypothetical protein TSUD_08710 [Trifolium subterraneum]|nr:hypothetical protein TSUD_08710 [Trifolium subterraneum]
MKVMKVKYVLMVAALTMMVGIVEVDSAPNTTCTQICGNVEIPYPFGINITNNNTSSDCFSGLRSIQLICNDSILYAGHNVPVLNINISTAQIDVLFFTSQYCGAGGYKNKPGFQGDPYTISSKENKFLTISNDGYGYLNSYIDNNKYSTGCVTSSFGGDPSLFDDGSGTCSGVGCCQVDIPPGIWNISIEAFHFNTSSEYCSYSFVVKNGNYNFNTTHIREGLPVNQLPMVLDWTVGDFDDNCSTASSKNDGVNYPCKNNSYCDDNATYNLGYLCRCKEGYKGNPYDPLGCTDINECENGTHKCKSKENCKNTIGNHTCFCPMGYSGYGTNDQGCQPHASLIVLYTVLGVGATFILLFLVTFSNLIYHKRKSIKLREKFFEQNGGLILKQKLSTREDSSSQTTQIFTRDQLNRATKNFDESLIIGKGGFGTVFKGFLDNERIVAIKKSKIIDRSQIDQFINEVVVLSQINHRNVVKLLGCCLETEVPLLVYEFVNNGTLSGLIHTQGNKVNNESWKTRLKIAAEVAGALSYLHSSASIPIIHRDVKSDNILLDGTNTAKVSDFGASRLVPLDQTEVATMVQGTIGYLDPEYMQTSQLTEKSDVYSFGVVLVELLTGERPFSFGRPEERRSLAMHFLSCLKKDNVFDVIQEGMLNEENKQEIREVVVLLMDKHSWINDDLNVEENQYLLHESSSRIYETGAAANMEILDMTA